MSSNRSSPRSEHKFATGAERVSSVDPRVIAAIGIAFSVLLLAWAFWPESQTADDGRVSARIAPAPLVRLPPEIAEPAAAEAVRFESRDPYSAVFDGGRHPKAVLAFYGVGPGMTVVELFGQLGYYTELLSAAVGPRGKVYVTRLARPNLERLRNVQAIADDLHEVPSDSVDLVFTHLNYHDLIVQKLDRVALLGGAVRVLKEGGVLAIIDHAAAPGSGSRDTVALHRIDEAFVRSEVQSLGFRLEASSALLRRTADTHRLRSLDDQIRSRTDRFMLRFVRPPGLRVPARTPDYESEEPITPADAAADDGYYPEEPTE